MIHKHLEAVAVTGASAGISPQRGLNNGSNTGLYGVAITGVASVDLEGSFTPDFAIAFLIDTITATQAKAFTLFPFVRFNVTSRTSGTITAWTSE